MGDPISWPSSGGQLEVCSTALEGKSTNYYRGQKAEFTSSPFSQTSVCKYRPSNEKDSFTLDIDDDFSMPLMQGSMGFGIFEWLISVVASAFAKKYDLPDPKVDMLMKHMKVEPEIKVIRDALYMTDTALNAMQELTERGYDERTAFKQVLSFIIERKTKPPRHLKYAISDPMTYCWGLSKSELKAIIREYPTLSLKVAIHQVELLAKSVPKSKRSTVTQWLTMLDKMSVKTVAPDEIDVKIIDESLTQTQEMLRNKMRETSSKMQPTFQEWTERLAAGIADTTVGPKDKTVKVTVKGLGEIVINLSGSDPPGQLATVRKTLVSVSKKLGRGKPVTEAELEILTSIVDSNPHLAGEIKLKLAPFEKVLRVSRLKVKIYKLALTPEGKGLRKALRIIEQCDSRPWRVMLPNGTKFKAQWVEGKLSIQAPPTYSFAPYAVKKYPILAVTADDAKMTDAIVIKDAYGEHSFVTQTDLLKLMQLQRKATKLSGKDAPVIRETLSNLITDLRIAWLSVDETNQPATAETNRTAKWTAKIQAELNWGRSLINEVGGLVNDVNAHCHACSYPPEQRTLLGPEKLNGVEDVLFETEWIRNKYRTLFYNSSGDQFTETPDAKEFNYLLDALADRLGVQFQEGKNTTVNGDVAETLSRIKTLVQRRMSIRSGLSTKHFAHLEKVGIHTPNLFVNVDFWLKNGEQVLKKGGLTDPQKNKLGCKPYYQDVPPSLTRARELLAQDSYHKAAHEYLRFALSSESSTAEKITAFVESVRAATAIQEYGRANMAVTEAAKLIMTLGEIPDAAKQAMKRLIMDSPWGKILDVPFEVSVQVKGETPKANQKMGMDAAIDVVEKALLGADPVDYFFDRIPALMPDSVPKLEEIATLARKNGLWRFPKDMLVRVATLTDGEFQMLIKTIPPGFENVRLCQFYRKARGIVLNSGYNLNVLSQNPVVVVMADQKPALFLVDEKPRTPKIVAGENGTIYIDADVQRSIKPWPWLSDAGNVAGHAALGAFTFMGAKYLIQSVTPEPTKNWEAMAQGHTILLTALTMDAAMHKGAEIYIYKSLSPKNAFTAFRPPNFSWGQLGGNIGTAMFAYRFVAGNAEIMGVSPEIAEWVGLGGTGAIFAGYRPLIKAISPRVYTDLIVKEGQIMSQVLGSGGRIVYGSGATARILSAEKAIAKGGLYYLLADFTLGAIDSIVDLAVDDVDGYIRNLEYSEYKSYINNRTFFGSNDDVNIFQQLGYTLWASADTIVPPAWHKLCNDVTGTKWREAKRAEIEQKIYNHHYGNAVTYAKNTALLMDHTLAQILMDEIWNPSPPTFIEILGRMTSRGHNHDTYRVSDTFAKWQTYASNHLTDDHQCWLFTNDVVAYGATKNVHGIAYWMEDRFLDVLNKLEVGIRDLEVSDLGDKAAREHALRVVNQYRSELKMMTTVFSMPYLTQKKPWQMPATF